MYIFFTNLIIKLAPYLNIRAHAAFPKTMVSLEKDFVSQSMLADISLNNFKQYFIATGKTGTAETYYNFPAMIHHSRNTVVKIKKIGSQSTFGD